MWYSWCYVGVGCCSHFARTRVFAASFLQCLDFIFIYTHMYALPFFKMDSSSECGTPNWTFLIIETVSDPVIEIKKADTTTKCFDSKWPFEDYSSRLSEAEILIFEDIIKNYQWVKSWVIFRRYGLLDPIIFALIMYVCLCTYTLTSPQLIIFRLIYRSGAKCRRYPDSPHYTHIWGKSFFMMAAV